MVSFPGLHCGSDPCSGLLQLPKDSESCSGKLCAASVRTRRKFYIARESVAAVKFYWPDLRYRLHRAWDCIKSWKLQTQLSSRIPEPVFILEALCLKALDLAMSGVLFWLCLCVLLRVGCFGLLRSGELLALERRSITRVWLVGQDPLAILAIVRPKTRAVFERSQFAVMRDLGAVLWLEWFCAGLPRATKLRPSSPWRFRQCPMMLLKCLGRETLKVNIGSLRPGVAMHYMLVGESVQILQHMGLRASDHSLHVYLQECVSIMGQS